MSKYSIFWYHIFMIHIWQRPSHKLWSLKTNNLCINLVYQIIIRNCFNLFTTSRALVQYHLQKQGEFFVGILLSSNVGFGSYQSLKHFAPLHSQTVCLIIRHPFHLRHFYHTFYGIFFSHQLFISFFHKLIYILSFYFYVCYEAILTSKIRSRRQKKLFRFHYSAFKNFTDVCKNKIKQ